MFIYSERLKDRIRSIDSCLREKTNGIVTYEEMIALPYFGQIILRFNLNKEDYTMTDLDYYENLISDYIGDEFLVDFMGDVYRKIGCDYSNQLAMYQSFALKYKDEEMNEGIYAKEIQEDAKNLLVKAELDSRLDVWEIQADEDEMVLLLLGEENKKIKEVAGLTVLEVEKLSCIGLLKALFYARRKQISLGRILMGGE